VVEELDAVDVPGEGILVMVGVLIGYLRTHGGTLGRHERRRYESRSSGRPDTMQTDVSRRELARLPLTVFPGVAATVRSAHALISVLTL
jgi:hypothetical protein